MRDTTVDEAAGWIRAKEGSADAGEVEAWHLLPNADRQRLRRRMKEALRHKDSAVRGLGFRIAETIEVAGWTGPGLSTHLSLEIAAAHHAGRPLDPRKPVPGCGCPTCTGISEDHPARFPVRRSRDLGGARGHDGDRWSRWGDRVEAARAVPLGAVARRLGCGEPVRRGNESAVRCPLHADRDPSLRIAADGRRWYCDPCGEGGDAIQLWMRVQGVSFVAAVRELATLGGDTIA